MINLQIDGNPVEVVEGSMVMDAANKLGSYIPHFCYHKKLSIAANCRMCLVEVEKAPKPLPACATPVSNGMIVHTKSAKAVQAQQSVMEFLLINHPLDCPICDQGGECQLQDLAVGYGASNSRYEEEKRVVPSKNIGPLISTEGMTRCIHCTRCVRFGVEIAGVMELGMVGRGEHSEITTYVGTTVDSELSGNMIDLCPVGALLSKPFLFKARTWELSRRKSVSPHDGLGANLIVQVKGGRVLRVLPFENEDVNECWLSDKDRFSYEALNSDERLIRPMLKQGGEWREVDWQDALEYVANGLKQIVAEHGASSFGALATPHSTLEELYLLQKLARGLGSENIDTRLRQSDFSLDGKAGFVPWLGMKLSEVPALDRVLIVGSFLRKDHPLIAARLRQVMKRGGKLSVVHAADDDLLMPVANKIIVAPSSWTSALAKIAAAVAGQKGSSVPAGFQKAAEPDDAAKSIATSLLSGTNRAVWLGNAAVQHPEYAQLAALAQWIASETGARFGFLTEAANTVGAALANARPGTASASAGGLNAAEMFAQPRRAYVLLNAEPEFDAANPVQAMAALAQADMVVALSAFKSAALDYADVLLPIAPFSETSGTFVSCEGRAQSFNGAVKPAGEARPGWKVLRVLGNMLGLSGFDYDTSEQVRNEVTQGETDLSTRCGNSFDASFDAPARKKEEVGAGIQRISDVPIYFADALVRRAASLQKTADARTPAARMSGKMLARLALIDGDTVRVVQDFPQSMPPPASQSATQAHAVLVCTRDDGVADGCVRIAAAHRSTSNLGAMFGTLSFEKIAPAAEGSKPAALVEEHV